jgi:hypothetical protein
MVRSRDVKCKLLLLVEMHMTSRGEALAKLLILDNVMATDSPAVSNAASS